MNTERIQKLATFQSITGIEDVNECLRFLEGHQWDLERAIQQVYDDLERNMTTTNEPPFRSVGSGPVVALDPPTGARVFVANSSRGSLWILPPSLSYLTIPLRLFLLVTRQSWMLIRRAFLLPLRYLMRMYSVLAGTFPGRIGQRPHAMEDPLDPTSAAQKFVTDFENIYGSPHPPFSLCSYFEALQQCKQQCMFLLVYLHAEDHEDTDRFCRDVLCSSTFNQFLHEYRELLLVWAGNVRQSEAYQVNYSLHACTYPFLALLSFHHPWSITTNGSGGSGNVAAESGGLGSSALGLLCRIEGHRSVTEVVRTLSYCIDQALPALLTARVDKTEREESRRLREEQDQAYAESLRFDEEKERQHQKMHSQLEQKENKRNQRRLRREEILCRLPAEPPATSIPLEENGPAVSTIRVARILFRLPNNDRIERRFYASDTVSILYMFMETCECILDWTDFQLCTNYPRRLLDKVVDAGRTIADLGLYPNGVIMVEQVDNDGEDIPILL